MHSNKLSLNSEENSDSVAWGDMADQLYIELDI